MKNNLIIIGASGHGKVVADIAQKMQRWEDIFFLDDNKELKTSMGIQVIGTINDISKYIETHDIVVGIGNNNIREKIQNQLELLGASIPILIHPSAIIGQEVVIGEGTVIMAGVVINCCTKIGKGCIINTSASIDHDNIIEDYVHISPGVHLAGTVKIGNKSWLGIGSIVSNNVCLSNNTTIGAGAVVIKSITQSGTYVGIPVRRL